jgi:hypothetical protein
MKKLLLIMLFGLSGFMVNAQDTFVRKYTTYVTNINNVVSEMKPLDITFVFNEGNSTDIVVYGLSEVKRFYRTGAISKSKTTGGFEYQWVDCIQVSTGYKASIQLFDEAVRIFMKGDYVEYQK